MNYIGHGGRLQFLFAGAHYEVNLTSGAITKYYFAGASRIAMRKYTIPQNMSVEYFLSDHLGSASITTDANGVKVSEMRYKPWGETRYTWTNAPANTSPAYELVKYQYTGQFSYEAEFGLYFYNARWYDPYLNHFTQPDSIVPDPYNSQSYDRYSYVFNNPLKYTDPTGHLTEKEVCKYMGYCDRESAEAGLGKNLFKLLWNTKITWGDTIILGNDENGAAIQATLVLFANTDDNSLTAALWNIDTGERVHWSTASEAEYSAAYNQKNDAWYSSDKNGNEWCNRDSCTAWAGGTPTTHTAEDLFVKENYVGYGLSNYYYFDGFAYASALWGVGKGAVDIYAAVQSGGALWPLAVDGVFIIGGAIQGLGPKATYPIVSFVNPHNPPPWYIPYAGFTPLP